MDELVVLSKTTVDDDNEAKTKEKYEEYYVLLRQAIEEARGQ